MADTLSIIADSDDSANEHNTDDVPIHATSVLHSLENPAMMNRPAKETKADNELMRVIEALESGQGAIGPLAPFKEELIGISGILLRESKVVIPKKLTREMLQHVHEEHLEIAKCKGMARLLMFWWHVCANSRNGTEMSNVPTICLPAA